MPLGIYPLQGPLGRLKGNKGVCDTRSGNATVYVKFEQPDPPPHVLAAEYVCAELAKLLRLPLPPSFIGAIPKTGELTFCSLNASMKGGSLPPIDAEIAVAEEPDLCSGVLVFDIWVANGDRHRKNLAYSASRPPHRLTIIDHSHALFTHPRWNSGNDGRLGIEGHLEQTNRHCLLDAISTDDFLGRWVDRVKGIRGDLIAEILKEATQLGLHERYVSEGYDFLIKRRDTLDSLIRSHKPEFTGIENWGLEWE